jgi:DNA polymerase-3 subunit alpha
MAALREPLRRDVRGVGGAHPLRAGRAEERGRGGDAPDRGGAADEGGGEKPFATLYDFARRVDLKRVGKRPLGDAGPFRRLRRARPQPPPGASTLDALVAYSAAIHEQKGSAQVSLFGEAGEDLPEPRLPDAEDWMPAARLAEEHHALGFYFSGHPLDDYMSALKRKGVLSYVEVEERARAAIS